MTGQQWKQAKSQGFIAYMRSMIKQALIAGGILVLAKVVLFIFNLQAELNLSDIAFYLMACLIAAMIFGVARALIGWAVNNSRVD